MRRRMARRMVLPMMLCLLFLFLSSCFEIEEKVTLAPTGEGSIALLVRIPIAGKGDASSDAGVKQTAEELSKELSGFTSIDMGSASAMGQTLVTVKATAPSFAGLAPFYGPLLKQHEKENQASDLGQVLTPKSFYAFKRKGDRLLITRTFTPPLQKKKKKTEEDKNAELLLGFMGGSFLRFELTVPGKVLSSNAEEASGSRLTWVVPMNYLQSHKVTFRAEVELSPEAGASLGRM